MWVHAMKRAIAPGGKVTLDELYDQYGKKHNLTMGEDFVNWLKTVKLKDTKRWVIVTDFDDNTDLPIEEVVEKKKSPTVKEMRVEDVLALSVRKARDVIPSITDIKLLKYALREATPLAGKDNLCRLIRSRIKAIQSSRV